MQFCHPLTPPMNGLFTSAIKICSTKNLKKCSQLSNFKLDFESQFPFVCSSCAVTNNKCQN